MKKLIFITMLVLFTFANCTENTRAKMYGGTATLEVPCGQRVTNITWKDTQLWYSTVPMGDNYTPVTHTFREESRFGVLKGKYILIEKKCK